MLFSEKYNDILNYVPSNKDNLQYIHDNINRALYTYNGVDHVISAEHICTAISKLKMNKSDGNKGLFSNHIIYTPYIFKVHLALMLSAMNIHGYMPNDMLKGTIVSLLKDHKGDHCDSENYRGICLCSSILKLYEWILVIRYSEKLCTSNLQFAFKEGHSTVNCTFTMKEVIKYYHDRGSDVYACVVDATKAFDRVRHDKLFQLLVERGIPPIHIRLIMNMYQYQNSRTVWNGEYSDYFTCQNGVRQGGVASPLFYTLYIDDLLRRLEKCGIGCVVGHVWYGGFSFADDLKLLCPSAKGLQKMLHICEEYGVEYGVLYNARKSMCMLFSKKKNVHNRNMPRIVLCGAVLAWMESIKYLGSYLTPDLSEENEIRLKQRDFISCVNSVVFKFGYSTRDVVMKLINAECCHFYGCEAWDLSQKYTERFGISWNIAMRKVWRLSPQSHKTYIVGLNNGHHALDLIYRRFLKMILKMSQQVKNDKMSFIVCNSLNDKRSLLYKNMAVIKQRWHLNDDMSINELCKVSNVCTLYPAAQDTEIVVKSIKELNSAIDKQTFIDGFNREDLRNFIELLTIS